MIYDEVLFERWAAEAAAKEEQARSAEASGDLSLANDFLKQAAARRRAMAAIRPVEMIRRDLRATAALKTA
ncbi:hypothetical protein Pan216_29330 [Planctomycetes bacterium Pan216]|uniref:Uncharacterized protein n=1 Tax=Kolteria novifilia TaxID=2527975 RepID=A0A518B515_9BACT|nr:hypothetical protein Pan216_29330 [Planctomycetes bacterium Pan216]